MISVGILIAPGDCPKWLALIINEIKAMDGVRLKCALICPDASWVGDGGAKGQNWALKLYGRFERWYCRELGQPDRRVSLSAALDGVATETVAKEDQHWRASDPGADLFLSLIEDGVRLLPRGLPVKEVWQPILRDSSRVPPGEPAVYELFHRHDVIGNELWSIPGGAENAVCLEQGFATTQLLSIYRNKVQLFRKMQTSILRNLRRLIKGADRVGWALNADAVKVYASGVKHYRPGNLQTLAQIALTLGRVISYKFRQYLTLDQWFIALFAGTKIGDFQKVTELTPARDRFWADPVPVVHNGRLFVFFEEAVFPRWRKPLLAKASEGGRARGVIKFVELDGEKVVRLGTALEVEHHISFPFLFQYQNQWFMIPEDSRSNAISVYKCRNFPTDWTYHTALLRGIRAADCVLLEHSGRWWLFATVSENGIGANDELCIFYADEPFGDWRPHAQNPVVRDVRGARNAGTIFRYNGELIRPSQIGAPDYGSGIRLNRIEELTEQRYRESTIIDLPPDWTERISAHHTYNLCGSYLVLDGLRQVRRKLW